MKNNPNPGHAEVLDYKIQYMPSETRQKGFFSIKITKIRLPDGKIMDDEDSFSSQFGCPHIYLERLCGFLSSGNSLHERVKKFMGLYNVHEILEPNNDCEHK